MRRKGKGSGKARSIIIQLVIAMPLLSIALALLCAKLMLGGSMHEEQMSLMAGVIAGTVSFLLCLYSAIRMPQKKILWGMLTAAGYACMLLLGNLLFFGVGYGNFACVLLPVFGAGLLASLLGAAKKRKFA